MGDNYLVINGQRIEFTEEQKKQLGIVEEKKSCFDRVSYGGTYYAIKSTGRVSCYTDASDNIDDSVYSVANYCTDEELMNQRALHEVLDRLLWRYSLTHDDEDKINWKDQTMFKWFVCYDHSRSEFGICRSLTIQDINRAYFYSENIARAAIEEVVKPFIRKHPEFVW